jgi:hypothetical protein
MTRRARRKVLLRGREKKREYFRAEDSRLFFACRKEAVPGRTGAFNSRRGREEIVSAGRVSPPVLPELTGVFNL